MAVGFLATLRKKVVVTNFANGYNRRYRCLPKCQVGANLAAGSHKPEVRTMVRTQNCLARCLSVLALVVFYAVLSNSAWAATVYWQSTGSFSPTTNPNTWTSSTAVSANGGSSGTLTCDLTLPGPVPVGPGPYTVNSGPITLGNGGNLLLSGPCVNWIAPALSIGGSPTATMTVQNGASFTDNLSSGLSGALIGTGGSGLLTLRGGATANFNAPNTARLCWRWCRVRHRECHRRQYS